MLLSMHGFTILYRASPVHCSRFRSETELHVGADNCPVGSGYGMCSNHVGFTTMEDLTHGSTILQLALIKS